MTAPTFSLSTTGSDPRITSKEALETEMQRCLDAVDATNDATAATLQGSIDGVSNDMDALDTALRSEIDAVATATTLAGNWSPSGGAFPSGASAGEYYIADDAGTVDGVTFAAGDWLIATVATPSTSTFAGNWAVGRYSQVLDQADGRAFGSIAELSAANVAQGQTVSVAGQQYEIVPAATYTANGNSVVDLSGVSGQAVLGPREDMDSGEAVLADTRGSDWFEAGQTFRAGGNAYRAVPTGGMVLTAGGARFAINAGRGVNVRDFGAVGDGATDDSPAFRSAIEALADTGGEVIVPSGSYLLSAAGGNPTDGVALVLEARHSNVTLVGRGRAVMIPASNMVEVLAQNGADRVRVKDLTFDNVHGALQNQVKNLQFDQPGNGSIIGNEANAAIRQYRGAGLAVEGCEFRNWITAIHYIGDTDDDTAIVGDFACRSCAFVGVAFGCLIDSPKTYAIADCVDVDGIDSIKDDGSRDPGHMIYGNNPLGAHPLSITVTGNRAYGRLSSPIKIRKGKSLAVTGNAIQECGRGMDISNCYGAIIEGNHIVLAPNAVDTKSVGIVVIDGGPGVYIGGNSVTVSGCDAWGVHVEAGNNDQPWHNLGVTIGPVKVIDDVAASQDRAAYRITDQQHCTIRGAEFLHTGTLQKSGYAIVAVNSTDMNVEGFAYRAVNTPPGLARVIQMRTNSTGKVRLDSAALAIGFRTDVVELESGSTVDFAIDGLTEVVETGQERTVRYADGRQESMVSDVIGTVDMTAGQTLQGTYTFARPFKGTQALTYVGCTPHGVWNEGEIAEAAEKLRGSASPSGNNNSVHWGLHAEAAYEGARLGIYVSGFWR